MFISSVRALSVFGVTLLLLACKGEETPLAPADARLNGTWFSQQIPGATLTINLDDGSALRMQQLIGSFNPNVSPNEFDLLGTTYVGITQGLNDNSSFSPVETYADEAFQDGAFPSSSFDVRAIDHYILWQHFDEGMSLGLRYTSALPSFFFFEMPFLLTQSDPGQVNGNAEWLHLNWTLQRFVLSYSLDTTTGPRPQLELFGIVFDGEPGGADLLSGSPWIFDDRNDSGLLARLVLDPEGFLTLEFELYIPFGGFLPPLGPLWGTALTYRYHDRPQSQTLGLIEHEPFQQYSIREIDDPTFSLRLSLWSLAEGHCSWTVPTSIAGQTAIVFVESPNPFTGLVDFDTLPVYTPIGEVDGIVGAWVNPDSGQVVTFSADGRWGSTSGASGHWREDGERIYYAEERDYQR